MDKIWYRFSIFPVYHKCDDISVKDSLTYCYKGDNVVVIPSKNIIKIITKEVK